MPIGLLIPLILQILSAIPSLVHAAESAFSKKDGDSSGKGAEKKAFVVEAVGTAIDVAKATGEVPVNDDQKNAIVTAAGALTDATVATFNAVGVFQKPKIEAWADEKSFTPGPAK